MGFEGPPAEVRRPAPAQSPPDRLVPPVGVEDDVVVVEVTVGMVTRGTVHSGGPERDDVGWLVNRVSQGSERWYP